MFEEGMRVRLLVRHPDNNNTYTVGSEGVVCDVANPDHPGIRWDEYSDQAHDCNGSCDWNHGWYVDDDKLEIVAEPKEPEDIDQNAFRAVLYL